MLIVIHCLDKIDHLELRMATRPAHLEWLKSNLPGGAYVGPLFGGDGKTFEGSLYILDFASLDAASEWIKDEPYYKAGLFEAITMHPSRNILPID